ncbi:hypothetical protein A4G19_02010 [Pasteurellaceae bacterium Macca]|nr:hypothetical protein [Pasteurellaceae bacterium Macca]
MKTMKNIIEKRIQAMKTAHASNKIEGIDIGDEAFNAMLERAKAPISNQEFAFQEISRVYAEHGLVYVK